jgi:hypothetical protein
MRLGFAALLVLLSCATGSATESVIVRGDRIAAVVLPD